MNMQVDTSATISSSLQSVNSTSFESDDQTTETQCDHVFTNDNLNAPHQTNDSDNSDDQMTEKTCLIGEINRLEMPHQIENHILDDSNQFRNKKVGESVNMDNMDILQCKDNQTIQLNENLYSDLKDNNFGEAECENWEYKQSELVKNVQNIVVQESTNSGLDNIDTQTAMHDNSSDNTVSHNVLNNNKTHSLQMVSVDNQDNKNKNSNNNTNGAVIPHRHLYRNRNISSDNPMPVVTRSKHGDVANEKVLEDRMKQLGLWENKLRFENILVNTLHQSFEQDNLLAVIDRCKRKRPIRDIPTTFNNDIVNVIQTKVVKDKYGYRKSYNIDIMMGVFTRDVLYTITDNEITVVGNTNEKKGQALVKEIHIQFPKSVDTSRLKASFSAGKFKCEAPFK